MDKVAEGLMVSGRLVGKRMDALQADHFADLAFATANHARKIGHADGEFTEAAVSGTIMNILQAVGMSLDDIEIVARGFVAAVALRPVDHLQRGHAKRAFWAGLWQSKHPA